MALIELRFRNSVTQFDLSHVREIVSSSGFFNAEEIAVAVELVDERIRRGIKSGYHFVFAEMNNSTVGYTCFGPIPATRNSYDLYWIAVQENYRGAGIGKRLLQESEEAIREMGGKRIYVETSSREQYRPTRTFYLTNGYREEAVLTDFYADGDSKSIYLKLL